VNDLPDRPASLAVRLAAWSLFTALAFGIAELAARLLFPLPEVMNFSRIAYSPLAVSNGMRDSPDLAHAAFSYESAPDNARFVHYLNLYGFRDRDWTLAKTRARRVFFVGDSFVEGFMSTDDDTIPRVFERAARSDGIDLEAWNLGVGATGLPEYVSLIQDAVPAFDPDEIIVVLYANDLFALSPFDQALIKKPFTPERRRAWDLRLVSAIAQIVHRQPIARAGHREPFPFFAAVPDPSNPWTANGAEYSRIVDPAIAEAMRQGRFNPFVVEETLGFARYLPESVDVGGYLQFLVRFLDARGVALRIAYLPYPNQVSDYYLSFSQRYCSTSVPSLIAPRYQVHSAIVAREAALLGIPFLDLSPLLRDEEARGSHMYWDYDEHMRPAGYAFVAHALYDWSTNQITRRKTAPSQRRLHGAAATRHEKRPASKT
jgi:hypothetical protein